ncbi:MAG TPA: SRPBCC family protein [Thermoanaerobaculia bacterium]|nr:SRPBCC family protein [Thermoanaerobaculia bacterium]
MRTHTKSWILGALLLVAAATAAPTAEPRSPARQRLAAGETLVKMAASGAEGRAWRVLDAPPERVRRAVADLRHYAEFFPFVRLSQAWQAGDGRLLTRQVLDVPFPQGERVVTAEVEMTESAPGAPVWTLRWESVADSEQQQRATWTVHPFAGGRTLVSIHLVTAAAGWTARLERRAVEQSLPWILDGLRQQVARCRYDLPIHESCTESPPFPVPDPSRPTPAPQPVPPASAQPSQEPPEEPPRRRR